MFTHQLSPDIGTYNSNIHRGHWNRIPVSKIFLAQPSPEAKVQGFIPMYAPLQVTKRMHNSTQDLGFLNDI